MEWVGILANFAVRIGLGHRADLISIGNIMLLIPGIAFTNSLRDLFSGDTITGLIRWYESCVAGICCRTWIYCSESFVLGRGENYA